VVVHSILLYQLLMVALNPAQAMFGPKLMWLWHGAMAGCM
jgi:hypothetical protein